MSFIKRSKSFVEREECSNDLAGIDTAMEDLGNACKKVMAEFSR